MASRDAPSDYEVRATRTGAKVGCRLAELRALKHGALPRARYLADADGPEGVRARGAWLVWLASADAQGPHVYRALQNSRDRENAVVEAAETARHVPFDYEAFQLLCTEIAAGDRRTYFDFTPARAGIDLMIAELNLEIDGLMGRARRRAMDEASAYQETMALRCAARGVSLGDAGVLADAQRELGDLFVELAELG